MSCPAHERASSRLLLVSAWIAESLLATYVLVQCFAHFLGGMRTAFCSSATAALCDGQQGAKHGGELGTHLRCYLLGSQIFYAHILLPRYGG